MELKLGTKGTNMNDLGLKLGEEKFLENNYAIGHIEDVDIRTVDIDDLMELASIQVPQGGKRERIHNYIKQTRNPYCFRIGKIAVQVDFLDIGDTLEDKLVEILAKL